MQQQCRELEEHGSEDSGGDMEVPVGGLGSPGLPSLPVLLLAAALFYPAKQQLWALLSTELAGKEIQKLPGCEGELFSA